MGILTDKGERFLIWNHSEPFCLFSLCHSWIYNICHQDLFQVKGIEMLMLSWISCCFKQNGFIVCFLKASVFLIMETINKLNGVIQNINRFLTLIICS